MGGWSWPDLELTPDAVINDAFDLMEETAEKEAVAVRQKELQLKALKAAKKASGRR